MFLYVIFRQSVQDWMEDGGNYEKYVWLCLRLSICTPFLGAVYYADSDK